MTRLFIRVTVATLIVFAFASYVLAQETNDAVKVEMYQRFVDNRLPHPDILRLNQAAKSGWLK